MTTATELTGDHGDPAPSGHRRRRAFVFGGGGVLGYAWMLGALCAVEEIAGVEAADSDILIGTSAGSVIAALVSCGLTATELRRHHQGESEPGDLAINWDYDNVTGGALPPRPSLRPGSPGLLLDALRHPRRVGPLLAVSAALPTGRGSLRPIRSAISDVIAVTEADRPRIDGHRRPVPWIVATDYGSGARVAFGRDQSAELPMAVVASCAIPAWYEPVLIDGNRYIDGGTVSPTSCDLLLGESMDEVYVLAPAASLHDVSPGETRGERVERWIRRAVTRAVRAEVGQLRSQGTRVFLVTPTTEDLALMGLNLMNPGRRREVLDTARRTSTAQLRVQLALPQ
jgi:NTE family protein